MRGCSSRARRHRLDARRRGSSPAARVDRSTRAAFPLSALSIDNPRARYRKAPDPQNTGARPTRLALSRHSEKPRSRWKRSGDDQAHRLGGHAVAGRVAGRGGRARRDALPAAEPRPRDRAAGRAGPDPRGQAGHAAPDPGGRGAGCVAQGVRSRCGALRARAQVPRKLHARLGRRLCELRGGGGERLRGQDRDAEPTRRGRRQPLPGRRGRLPAAERLPAPRRRRRGGRGAGDGDRLGAERRLRFCAARSRVSRPLVVAHDRRRHADQHRSADDAVDHALQLPPAHPPRARVRAVRRAHVALERYRADERHAHPRLSEIRRPAPLVRAGERLGARGTAHHRVGRRRCRRAVLQGHPQGLLQPRQGAEHRFRKQCPRHRQAGGRGQQPLHLPGPHALCGVLRVRRQRHRSGAQLPARQARSLRGHPLPAPRPVRPHLRGVAVGADLVRPPSQQCRDGLRRRHHQRSAEYRALVRRSAPVRGRRRRPKQHAADRLRAALRRAARSRVPHAGQRLLLLGHPLSTRESRLAELLASLAGVRGRRRG